MECANKNLAVCAGFQQLQSGAILLESQQALGCRGSPSLALVCHDFHAMLLVGLDHQDDVFSFTLALRGYHGHCLGGTGRSLEACRSLRALGPVDMVNLAIRAGNPGKVGVLRREPSRDNRGGR